MSQTKPTETKRALRGWMTQMQLPAMLSTHPHYSLCRHLGLCGARGSKTSLFSHCFSLRRLNGSTHSSAFSKATGCCWAEDFYIPQTCSRLASIREQLWSAVSLESLEPQKDIIPELLNHLSTALTPNYLNVLVLPALPHYKLLLLLPSFDFSFLILSIFF